MEKGEAAVRAGRYSESEDCFRSALQHALDLNPRSKMAEESEEALGAVLYRNGRFAAAEDLFIDSIKNLEGQINKADCKEDRQKATLALSRERQYLGDCYRAEGKYKQAEAIYRRALKALPPGADADDLSIAILKSDLGDVLNAQGKYREAEVFYQQALPVLQKSKANDQLLDLLEEYQSLLRLNNRMQEAQKLDSQITNLRNLGGVGSR